MHSFADISFYSNNETADDAAILEAHKANLLYLSFLNDLDITVYKHMDCVKSYSKNKIQYYFNKRRNSNFQIPFSTIRQIKKNKHDVILVHGLQYAFLATILKHVLKRGTKIIMQHHAEKPFDFPKSVVQRIADTWIDAYLFVSVEQAIPFLENGIISRKEKIYEVMEGSTLFRNFGLERKTNSFIWVGRLDENKDPLTVLRGFNKYVQTNPGASLKMVYNETNLLPVVEVFIRENRLEQNVVMCGRVVHAELEKLYNEAEYFIIGSHYEGSGYALCESMACGCIPIVTSIPSFRQMTNDGDCGFLFEAGSAEDLFQKLLLAGKTDRQILRGKVLKRFEEKLSFAAIAKGIGGCIQKLAGKK